MLIYVGLVLSTSVLSDLAAFIGLALIGAVYWTVVEQHSNMRFAWINKDSADDIPAKESSIRQFIYIAYNLIWWIPIVLAVFKIIDYWTAFIALLILTAIRAVVNLYRNNVLNSMQAESFPLRAVWIVEIENWYHQFAGDTPGLSISKSKSIKRNTYESNSLWILRISWYIRNEGELKAHYIAFLVFFHRIHPSNISGGRATMRNSPIWDQSRVVLILTYKYQDKCSIDFKKRRLWWKYQKKTAWLPAQIQGWDSQYPNNSPNRVPIQ